MTRVQAVATTNRVADWPMPGGNQIHATACEVGEPWRLIPRRSWCTRRLVSRRGLQIVLGWLWIIDAALQSEPANFVGDFPLGHLAQSAMGSPPWEKRAILAGIGPFVGHWPLCNVGVVLLEAVIGLSLVLGQHVRTALAVSVVWSLVIWVLGEGMGMLPTGFAMLLFGAPGAAVLYALLAVLSWPRVGRRDVSAPRWASAFLTLWGGSAVLQLAVVFPIRQSLNANFGETSAGQRSWLVTLSDAAARIGRHDPLAVTVLLAGLQLTVASGWLVDRRHPRRWLGLAIVLTLVYWIVGQCLGSVLSSGATDVGTGPLVVLLCLVAWPRSAVHPPMGQPLEGATRNDLGPAA